jgi:uncharacterized protein (TIGR00251 family)
MLIKARAFPRSSRNLVKEEKGLVKVYVTAPAQDGLANKKLIGLLAEHFKVKIYRVKIVKGALCRDKLVEIPI